LPASPLGLDILVAIDSGAGGGGALATIGLSSSDAGGRAFAAGAAPVTLVRCGAIFASGSTSALFST
jgi:hypothetical protein